MISQRDVSLTFAAGCLGGLANGLGMWALGHLGLIAALGVKLTPVLSPGYLYPRVVWGGIWGLIFLLPVLRKGSWVSAGLLASLAPSLVLLCYLFPEVYHRGFAGHDLGRFTFVVVLVVNALWGLATAGWLRGAR